jgi:hypothetical protein
MLMLSWYSYLTKSTKKLEYLLLLKPRCVFIFYSYVVSWSFMFRISYSWWMVFCSQQSCTFFKTVKSWSEWFRGTIEMKTKNIQQIYFLSDKFYASEPQINNVHWTLNMMMSIEEWSNIKSVHDKKFSWALHIILYC